MILTITFQVYKHSCIIFCTLLHTFVVHMCTFVNTPGYCIHTHTQLHLNIRSMCATLNNNLHFILESVEEFITIENQPTTVDASSRMEIEHVAWSHILTTHVEKIESYITLMWWKSQHIVVFVKDMSIINKVLTYLTHTYPTTSSKSHLMEMTISKLRSTHSHQLTWKLLSKHEGSF